MRSVVLNQADTWDSPTESGSPRLGPGTQTLRMPLSWFQSTSLATSLLLLDWLVPKTLNFFSLVYILWQWELHRSDYLSLGFQRTKTSQLYWNQMMIADSHLTVCYLGQISYKKVTSLALRHNSKRKQITVIPKASFKHFLKTFFQYHFTPTRCEMIL